MSAGVSFAYTFNTTLSGVSAPGTGQIEYSSATISDITNVYVSRYDSNGDDLFTLLNYFVTGSLFFTIYSASSPNNYVTFYGTDAVYVPNGFGTPYFSILVFPNTNSGALPTNGENIVFTLGGIQGPQGITGIQGQPGAFAGQGYTGVQGVAGTTGVSGATGVDGLFAGQGVTGVQGDTGVQGIQGQTGVQGNTGVAGATGLRGTTGVQGIQGTTGVAGVTGVGVLVDNVTLVNMGGVVSVANQGISNTQLALDSVDQPQIVLRAAPTSPQVAGGVAISAGNSGSFSWPGGGSIQVPNCALTLTTLGNPVMIMFIQGTSSQDCWFINETGGSSYFYLMRDVTQLPSFGDLTNSTVHAGAYNFLDFPPAGTHTYTLYAFASGTNSNAVNVALMAYEIK